jgi:hypothetical protein
MERGGKGVSFSAPKAAALVIWILGLGMTYAAINQMTTMNSFMAALLAVSVQLALTVGQGPVWAGRGGVFAYSLLVIDAIINFGGVMAIFVNVDQVGSVQALQATFIGTSSMWPMWVKGIVALVISAGVAGLPEYFWSLGKG